MSDIMYISIYNVYIIMGPCLKKAYIWNVNPELHCFVSLTSVFNTLHKIYHISLISARICPSHLTTLLNLTDGWMDKKDINNRKKQIEIKINNI